MKLNIGAGDTQIDGFTPVDRKFGQEAYPLDYPDNSVEEIRASHVLEHFARAEVGPVLNDWVRVLQPGGKLRVSVPDFNVLMKDYSSHVLFEAFLMGGQMDENDFHKVIFTEQKLRQHLETAGLSNIQTWEDPEPIDTAALPLSLNLEGIKMKEKEKEIEVKVAGVMTVPRCGLTASRGLIERAFQAHEIPFSTTNGVFWHECMQQMFETCLDEGVDIIVTVDYDTCLTKDMLGTLLLRLVEHDDIDCLCALESRRNADTPLMTKGGATEVVCDGNPMLATTAHFGLTAIRVENLKKVEKPWFFCQPDEKGEWGNDKLDADIWFWHQWRKCGNNLYVDPQVRIGHLEETVAWYDERMQLQRTSVPEWRNIFMHEGKGDVS